MLRKGITVHIDLNIRDAIRSLDKGQLGIVIVVGDNKTFKGLITDGDMRRGLLNGFTLEDKLVNIINSKCILGSKEISEDKANEIMQNNLIKHLPLVDYEGKYCGIYIFSDQDSLVRKFDYPVLIMAGGFGKRLMPLTKDKPKPMLKVNNMPILEIILNNFKKEGFKDIYISVGYKKEIIMDYFKDGSEFGLNINYLKEEKPLGTGGCLFFLKEKIKKPLLVSNGDILTKVNYKSLIDSHIKTGSDVSICGVSHQYQFPFGVIKEKGNGQIMIDEKPVISRIANAGIYVLNNEVYKYLEYEYRDITDIVIGSKKVNIFTLYEDWLDVGSLDNFKLASDFF